MHRPFVARTALATLSVSLLITFMPATASAVTGPALRPLTAGHPYLVLTGPQIRTIRSRIKAHRQPEAAAWSTFVSGRVRMAMSAKLHVLRGPFRGSGDIRSAFTKTLTADGSCARDLAIAWILSGKRAYAARARMFLLAWAKGNTPTTLRDYDSLDTGQVQCPGGFSLAYAYDVTYNSGVYSTADRTAIVSYFRRFIAALKNDMTTMSGDPLVKANSPERRPYLWNSALTYRFIDGILGGDFSMLEDATAVAMAADIGDRATVSWAFANSHNVLRVPNTLTHALVPANSGDGMGTTPAPQSHIYKANISGRGGTLDYCTYNDRLASVLADMGQHLGYGTLSTYTTRLRASWLYLAKFFGPGALRSPNPYDSVNRGVDLPRFALAYHEFSGSRLLAVVRSGARTSYYEPQLLGPVTLTHSGAH